MRADRNQQRAEDDLEHDDADAVVEEALRLDEQAQPPWHPQLAQQREHRHWIGRRDDGADQQRDPDRQRGAEA